MKESKKKCKKRKTGRVVTLRKMSTKNLEIKQVKDETNT